MRRLFYALALHGYLWSRHSINQPFSWFLDAYDQRKRNEQGGD